MVKEVGGVLQFLVGITIGLVLGTVVSAYATEIYGSGYLMGWDVVTSGGKSGGGHVICRNPFADVKTKEIECTLIP